jgi:hypothetical protein
VSTKTPRTPSIQDGEPVAGSDEPQPDGNDVEGHSLLGAQFGQQMAATRSREAAEWARGEKARREAEKDRKNRKGR